MTHWSHCSADQTQLRFIYLFIYIQSLPSSCPGNSSKAKCHRGRTSHINNGLRRAAGPSLLNNCLTQQGLVCFYGKHCLRIDRERESKRGEVGNMLRSHGGNLTVSCYLIQLKMPWERIREAGYTSAGRASVPEVCREVNSKKQVCPPLSIKVLVFVLYVWISRLRILVQIMQHQIRKDE